MRWFVWGHPTLCCRRHKVFVVVVYHTWLCLLCRYLVLNVARERVLWEALVKIVPRNLPAWKGMRDVGSHTSGKTALMKVVVDEFVIFRWRDQRFLALCVFYDSSSSRPVSSCLRLGAVNVHNLALVLWGSNSLDLHQLYRGLPVHIINRISSSLFHIVHLVVSWL